MKTEVLILKHSTEAHPKRNPSAFVRHRGIPCPVTEGWVSLFMVMYGMDKN